MNPWIATQLVLATLKLCKVIDWSWWLVFMPFWIATILTLGLNGLQVILEHIVIHRHKNMTPQQTVASKCRALAEHLKKENQ